MKLRIKGDALRLRVSPSEMNRLLAQGCVEETIHFGPAEDAHLTYALEVGGAGGVTVRHEGARVAVLVPAAQALAWAESEEVGVYGELPLASGRLEVAVEKDWACLDKNDADNTDTFRNPNEGAVC